MSTLPVTCNGKVEQGLGNTQKNTRKQVHHFSIMDVCFQQKLFYSLYLFNGEVPGSVDNVLSGACEYGHLVVHHLWRVLQGGSDLQVETVGVIWGEGEREGRCRKGGRQEGRKEGMDEDRNG